MSDASASGSSTPAVDWLAIAPSEVAALRAPAERGLIPGLLEGVAVGPWRLQALLGAGGMGEVYRAAHTDTGAAAALKLLRAAPWLAGGTGLARFRREARVAAAITHPNVVPLLDVGEQQGTWWLALALVEGASLQRFVEANGPLPWRLALRAIGQAACGLQAAHDNCIVHRDVKPANIVLGLDGRARITDFGIAADPDTADAAASLTLTGQALGTPAFMSPEQCTGGDVDGRSDLYALGATLFCCCAGTPPFVAGRGGALALLEQQVRAAPPRVHEVRPDVPEPVSRIVAKLMRKRPADRYQTAAAFVADAVAVLAGGEPALASGDDTSVRYTRVFTDATVPDAAVESALAEQRAARARGERPAPLGELLARQGAVDFGRRPIRVAGREDWLLSCAACEGALAPLARPLPACPTCGGPLEAPGAIAVGEAFGRLTCVPPADAADLGEAVVPLLAAGVDAGWLDAAVDCTALGRMAEHETIWITDALELLLSAGGSLALVVPEARTRAFLAAVGIDQYVRVVESRAALAAVEPTGAAPATAPADVREEEPTPVG